MRAIGEIYHYRQWRTGFSYALLDHIYELAEITYVGWAKHTGAGDGRFAIILPRLDARGNDESWNVGTEDR